MKFKTIIITLLLLTILSAGTSLATPKLDKVSFDPAFISAGDRVQIAANIYEQVTKDMDKNRENRRYKMVLKPDNKLAKEYVTIEDEKDNTVSFIAPRGVWNQIYQVKIDSGAPTGEYKFKIHIEYIENGERVEIPGTNGSLYHVEKFTMPVDNEGVDMTSNIVSTEPTIIRPGYNNAELKIDFTNTGNKEIQEIEIKTQLPENITSALSSNEKFYINQLQKGETSTKTLTIDVKEGARTGNYPLNLTATYEDDDSNVYTEKLSNTLRVEGKSDLKLTESSMNMKAGTTDEMRFTVKNTGEQDAESVTARIIAERTQPFNLEDRSAYIGEIKAGETAEATLEITSDRTASLRKHQLRIQLRSLGDSEEGDNSVYLTNENFDITLTERTTSIWIYVGMIGAGIIALIALIRYYFKKQ